MEKVKNIVNTFFDVNAFSVKKLIIAAIVLIGFFMLKTLFARIVMRIFKVRTIDAMRKNSFYKPLKLFFAMLGLYLSLIIIGPSSWFKGLIDKSFRVFIILISTFAIGNLVGPKSRFAARLKKKLSNVNESMIKMICKVIKAIVYVIGIVVLISELGYNISGIVAGLGIVGVAVSLAAQDTASNIIGAAMLFIDKPFEVGDWINVEGKEGSVEEITFRSTRIREAKNCVVSIPNSKIVNSLITNWTKLEKRRIQIQLVLEFNTSLKKLADVQNDILIYLENEENILADGLFVKFDAIKDDGYNLNIVCFTPIINYIDYLTYLDSLNFKIMSILNKHKVSLAYKSQTIYLEQKK